MHQLVEQAVCLLDLAHRPAAERVGERVVERQIVAVSERQQALGAGSRAVAVARIVVNRGRIAVGQADAVGVLKFTRPVEARLCLLQGLLWLPQGPQHTGQGCARPGASVQPERHRQVPVFVRLILVECADQRVARLLELSVHPQAVPQGGQGDRQQARVALAFGRLDHALGQGACLISMRYRVLIRGQRPQRRGGLGVVAQDIDERQRALGCAGDLDAAITLGGHQRWRERAAQPELKARPLGVIGDVGQPLDGGARVAERLGVGRASE